MGLVASSALENGGQVHGIIPKAFLVATNGEKGEGASSQEEEIGKTVNLEGQRSKVTVVGGMHEVSRSLSSLICGSNEGGRAVRRRRKQGKNVELTTFAFLRFSLSSSSNSAKHSCPSSRLEDSSLSQVALVPSKRCVFPSSLFLSLTRTKRRPSSDSTRLLSFTLSSPLRSLVFFPLPSFLLCPPRLDRNASGHGNDHLVPTRYPRNSQTHRRPLRRRLLRSSEGTVRAGREGWVYRCECNEVPFVRLGR